MTDRVVRQVIHRDSSEVEIIETPKQLPLEIQRMDTVADLTQLSPAPSDTLV